MVFTPIRGAPFDPDDAKRVLDAQLAAKAVRAKSTVHPSSAGRRLAWRAVVRMRDRNTVSTEWHLAACSASADADAHCPEGRGLISTTGDPEGHCLIGGQCPRCDAPL